MVSFGEIEKIDEDHFGVGRNYLILDMCMKYLRHSSEKSSGQLDI